MTTSGPDGVNPTPRHRRRAALALSCLVYPGAGQALQKRWAAACSFALLFTVCVAGLFFSVLGPLWKNVAAALNFAARGGNGSSFVSINPVRVLGWLVAGLAIYTANAVDAHLQS